MGAGQLSGFATWFLTFDAVHGDARAGARWGIPPFFVARGPHGAGAGAAFNFGAPTTARNALRVLRALQLRRAVLLEGSPGVGKTSLVAALARATGGARALHLAAISWEPSGKSPQTDKDAKST